MRFMTNILFFVVVFLVGGTLFQIFLSKRQSKWLGLILPGITFLYSLVMVLGIAVYDGMGSWDIVVLVGTTFLLSNIPTIILLGIYLGCREKIKRLTQIEKMNIQDLE